MWGGKGDEGSMNSRDSIVFTAPSPGSILAFFIFWCLISKYWLNK